MIILTTHKMRLIIVPHKQIPRALPTQKPQPIHQSLQTFPLHGARFQPIQMFNFTNRAKLKTTLTIKHI